MIFNVSAGHNPDGRIGCGAIGLIKESTEARNVKNEVIRLLRENGQTVYDCTVDNGTSQGNVLTKIIQKCKAHKVDLDVSIHFNAGANDERGNGKTTGTEVLLFQKGSGATSYAESVCKEISALGLKSRGIKYRENLYYLKNTPAPAMIIECCFVDDKEDVEIYDYQSMAKAIVKGLIGFTVEDMDDEIDDGAKEEGSETPTGDRKALYRVQVGAYSVKDNADNLKEKLKKAGFDAVVVKS